MSSERSGSRSEINAVTPFTPVPNELIDKVMPSLRDTEWRLLCVILRQTLGWSDGRGGRKERDWLTQGQLMARTGRSSAAVSAAVDTLVRLRLIGAYDADGRPLPTPAKRRHQGRIFYGLCRTESQERPRETSGHASSHASDNAKSELQKANITKENGDKRNLYIRKASTGKRRQRHADAQDILAIGTGWARAEEVAARRYGLGYP